MSTLCFSFTLQAVHRAAQNHCTAREGRRRTCAKPAQRRNVKLQPVSDSGVHQRSLLRSPAAHWSGQKAATGHDSRTQLLWCASWGLALHRPEGAIAIAYQCATTIVAAAPPPPANCEALPGALDLLHLLSEPTFVRSTPQCAQPHMAYQQAHHQTNPALFGWCYQGCNPQSRVEFWQHPSGVKLDYYPSGLGGMRGGVASSCAARRACGLCAPSRPDTIRCCTILAPAPPRLPLPATGTVKTSMDHPVQGKTQASTVPCCASACAQLFPL